MANKILKHKKLYRVLASTFILTGILSVGGKFVTDEWATYINKFLGISGTKIEDVGGEQDPTHYKSDFSNYKDVMNNARKIAKEVQNEGTVLMTNKNNALPLAKGSKVSFLSYSTSDIAYGGTGSGGVTASEERKVDLKDACIKDSRIDINNTLYDFYKGKLSDNYLASKGQLQRKLGGGWGPTAKPVTYQVPEIKPNDFPSEVKESLNTYNDAAVFVLSRIGGEGNDLLQGDSNENKHYLKLTEDEKAVLETMKNGNFKKRIVLVNTFNTPELGWLDEYNIDACVYIGGPGEVGLDSVIDVLVGNVNPSGKLADTYAYNAFAHPSMQNFGDFTFANHDAVTNPDSKKYLMYNEGIYVGYRYFETRYEDSVLNRGNATSAKGAYQGQKWDYSKEVQFPFGHGLSYTNFEQKLDSVTVNEGLKTAEIKVSVKNIGTTAGKDVVEIYAQSPYIEGGVEKSAVQLCGFHKTEVIKPNESKLVTYTVDLNDIASYDYKNNKTYILDEGTYYFSIGNGAHEAINNILLNKNATLPEGEKGNKENAISWTKKAFSNDEYSLSKTNKKVTNKFEKTDINYYKEGEDIVKYLSRSDWGETYPKNMTGFKAPNKMLEDISALYSSDNKPSAYVPGNKDTSSIVLGSKETQYNIAMMKGVSYDDDSWDALLNQITLEEMVEFTKQGRPQIASINQPETTAVDGPAAWTKSTYVTKYDDYDGEKEKTNEAMVLYPTETVVASTWNLDLTNKLGLSFGEEGLWGGGVGWYGPGANIHRTPFGGRNFEYFSEDGFISGKLSEAETKGAMEKGVIPYLKHFFLNDQETNRIGVCTFSNEQALREIYLRGFQYAFEASDKDDKACTGVMGAFNRLGVTWTGHDSNLWKEVMEGEWGFKGNVTTDFGQKPQSLMEPQLALEAGTTMFCTSGSNMSNIILEKAPNDLKLLTNLREATHRNLYNFANSAAMNGLTSTARVVKVMTWYEAGLISLISISSVMGAASIGLVVYTTFKKEEN